MQLDFSIDFTILNYNYIMWVVVLQVFGSSDFKSDVNFDVVFEEGHVT